MHEARRQERMIPAFAQVLQRADGVLADELEEVGFLVLGVLGEGAAAAAEG